MKSLLILSFFGGLAKFKAYSLIKEVDWKPAWFVNY